MYKIIQTVENGKPQLCIVPESWEMNGILFWPKSKADKLVKDPQSMPGQGWFEMPCQCKRKMLSSMELAEQELKKMLQSQDTGEESDIAETVLRPMQRIKKPKVHLPRVRNKENNAYASNFNSIAELCSEVSC